MISRVINLRYEVLERVGEGTFFQVFKARDRVMNRMVAVKALQPLYASDRGFCDALRKLATDTGSLAHANIARLYEVIEDDGQLFVVTEFVRGINLKERIRRIAPFNFSVAVDFSIAIGEALHYAHSEGIIHGDLRPQNVVVSPEGAIKVTDFGLAKVMAASHQALASNLGRSAPYQAPEITSGRYSSIPSDIYGLGCILFEMVTGGIPFPGETPFLIAMKHQKEPVPSPRSLNQGVPRSLEGIVMKALQKSPEDRYHSVPDMLNDLKTVRDALRFGKPLSWSPMETGLTEATAPASANSKTNNAVSPSQPPNSPSPTVQPAASGASRMSSAYTSDDRINPFLKGAIYFVIFVVLVIGIVFTAMWFAATSAPPAQVFPRLIGMNIDDARKAAEKVNVHLTVHEEFSQQDPGIIWRVEPDFSGKPIPPGRSINVWVSKGSRTVWVPSVRRTTVQEAENKLKAEGLTLGLVNRENSQTVLYDNVISQNPSAGKRVDRGTPVNLIVSDGPDYQGNSDNTQTNGDTTGDNTGDNSSAGSDMTVRTKTLKFRIKQDNLGQRRVRVQYDDANGTHTPLDEVHGEGDWINLKVDVTGATWTYRIYYDDTLQVEHKADARKDE